MSESLLTETFRVACLRASLVEAVRMSMAADAALRKRRTRAREEEFRRAEKCKSEILGCLGHYRDHYRGFAEELDGRCRGGGQGGIVIEAVQVWFALSILAAAAVFIYALGSNHGRTRTQVEAESVMYHVDSGPGLTPEQLVREVRMLRNKLAVIERS